MNWLENTCNFKVEITSYCNAACPGCIRNVTGGKTVDSLDLEHMSIDVWRRFVEQDTKDIRIREMLFDGNVGDFCMNPDALDFVKLFIAAHPKSEVHINTNGGARSIQFWKDLGSMLSNINHRVNFAIDGLEDTHHIHRRRTTYEMVTRNMQAFISTGGRANWVYTAFGHNVHQIAEARDRAEKMQCSFFEVRQSCIDSEDLYTKTDTEEYTIETDSIRDVEEYQDKLIEEKHKIIIREVKPADSPCKAYAEHQMTIDWRGTVWPCTYVYATEVTNQLSFSPFKNGEPWPGDEINLKHNTFIDIVNSTFYKNTVPDAVSCGKWDVCKMQCI